MNDDWSTQLRREGFALFRGEFSRQQVQQMREQLADALSKLTEQSGAISHRNGAVYAARNLLDIYPASHHLWRTDSLLSKLQATLGSKFGLVRGLYFDKHPERSWALPWHRDRTIAVENNALPSRHFVNPTRKAGIAHVEAPQALLSQMLTLRIHLDDVDQTNGPLKVIASSHMDADGDDLPKDSQRILSIHAAAGDVLAMRPLISHASGNSEPGARHRRIIHLEFAPSLQLADGYRWRHFLPS